MEYNHKDVRPKTKPYVVKDITLNEDEARAEFWSWQSRYYVGRPNARKAEIVSCECRKVWLIEYHIEHP